MKKFLFGLSALALAVLGTIALTRSARAVPTPVVAPVPVVFTPVTFAQQVPTLCEVPVLPDMECDCFYENQIVDPPCVAIFQEVFEKLAEYACYRYMDARAAADARHTAKMQAITDAAIACMRGCPVMPPNVANPCYADCVDAQAFDMAIANAEYAADLAQAKTDYDGMIGGMANDVLNGRDVLCCKTGCPDY